ncbi:hypothetical protein CEXT_396441 [Caerostris extrusa]|uniref:Uncharacterized protein n=1 Tax=Caerostris extrusa TaxID=172846 RepID=A0AAV4Y6H8_CAEEX|nr:hypothetical protein CEXT_396441 [Caerostris extrusa]
MSNVRSILVCQETPQKPSRLTVCLSSHRWNFSGILANAIAKGHNNGGKSSHVGHKKKERVVVHLRFVYEWGESIRLCRDRSSLRRPDRYSKVKRILCEEAKHLERSWFLSCVIALFHCDTIHKIFLYFNMDQ